jgi:uncharacterized protein Smg (DUF494 family)
MRPQKTIIENQNINILNVLSEVFRIILSHHLQPEKDKKPLSIKLKAEGISEAVVEKSLLWLKKFFDYRPELYEKLSDPALKSNLIHRFYAPQEIARIGEEGPEFLNTLCFEHILPPAKREFLMDCIMGEDIAPLTLPQLQFLTFVTLTQDCKKPEEVAWLEEIILKRDPELTTLAH